MGANTGMLWFVDSEDPVADLRFGVRNDGSAASQLAQAAVGDAVLVPRGETTLDRVADVALDEIAVGSFGRIAVIVGGPVAVDRPSGLSETVIGVRPARTAHLIVTDLDRSFGAFATWEDGTLRRSFASDPVDIVENIGLPFVFEREFWAGERPLRYNEGVMPDPQALPFHPTEFADHAASQWVGLRLTQPHPGDPLSPAQIPVSRFAIRPPGHQPTAQDHETARAGHDDHHEAPPAAEAPEPDVSAPTKVARWFGFGRR
ncbi:DUF6928 family protein [Williamsia deligens]|uniref:DUF6928 family protein n=1 Tax=Williamsia deligens TaxID=321325 RepID=A0ABW3G9T0_9NOCA|nr:hypothetical protein [Williamsia deligens]MCP2192821.1 hypothetical protein [Williamsia deligens]